MKFWTLTLWMLATLILTFSIIGMLIFIAFDYGSRSTWMTMGFDLSKIKSDKTCNGILYFIWVILSLILVLSVVGLACYIKPDGLDRSTWLQIGTNLKDDIVVC